MSKTRSWDLNLASESVGLLPFGPSALVPSDMSPVSVSAPKRIWGHSGWRGARQCVHPVLDAGSQMS